MLKIYIIREIKPVLRNFKPDDYEKTENNHQADNGLTP